MERDDKNMKICQFCGREFMSLSQKYEERVRHHLKAELYRYSYILIFGKHLSELYWIALICFEILNALLARTSNRKSSTGQPSSPSCHYITSRAGKTGQEL